MISVGHVALTIKVGLYTLIRKFLLHQNNNQPIFLVFLHQNKYSNAINKFCPKEQKLTFHCQPGLLPLVIE